MFEIIMSFLLLTSGTGALTYEERRLDEDSFIGIPNTDNQIYDDPRYRLRWGPGYSNNVPSRLRCARALTSVHSRFVCSASAGVSRSFCMPECQIGYTLTKPRRTAVYICHNDGHWSDVYQNSVGRPDVQCA